MTTFWRLYWLGDGRLFPISQSVNTPVARRTVARCVDHPDHQPPEPDCLCGLYAGTAEALHPLAVGLLDMTDQCAAAGITPVVVAVELDNPVRTVHAAYSPAGAMHLMALRARGVNALVEGRDTWRGSALTIVGPLHVPTVPGITRGAVTQAARRYKVQVEHADGDIADLVERLAT